MEVSLVSMTQIDKNYLEKLMKEVDNPDFIKNVQGPEGLMAYVARVSSPNPTNKNYSKLLNYCAKQQHWSVFEMADACFEIKTSLSIAAQILRHRSFCFQQYSLRYSKANMEFEVYEARSQDEKNRQNSIDNMSEEDKQWFRESQQKVAQVSFNKYSEALDRGIAKEQARFLLPSNTLTKLHMKGSIRSWIHYINLRQSNGTQKEHADIAIAIKKILKEKLPIVAESMNW